MHKLLHKINLLVELFVIGTSFILEARGLLLKLLQLSYVVRMLAYVLPDVTDPSIHIGLGLIKVGLILDETSLYLF
jgi:hypothetical protein